MPPSGSIRHCMAAGSAAPKLQRQADVRGGNAVRLALAYKESESVNDCYGETVFYPRCAPSCARPPRSWAGGRAALRRSCDHAGPRNRANVEIREKSTHHKSASDPGDYRRRAHFAIGACKALPKVR
jgi:hypothetical protein